MNAYDILIKTAEDKGIEKGIDLGRQEGVSLKEKEFAASLILSTDFDDAKIALLVGVSEEYVLELRKEYSQLN